MKFAVQINTSPYQNNRGDLAYRFICAALAGGHQVYRVFFYQEGIYHALAYASPLDDELNHSKRWADLAAQYDLDLVLCISAAQRRGLLHADEAKRQGKLDNDVAAGFRVAGLGQLLEATLLADRFLVF